MSKQTNMGRILTRDDATAAANLRRIWNEKAARLKLTQQSAAKESGWSQSTVSQYLNCKIALGPDAVLEFARLLGVIPTDIDPRLARFELPPELRNHTKIKITNVEPEAYVDAPAPSASAHGVKQLTREYEPWIQQGEVLLIDPESPINPGDRVLVTTRPYKLGYLIERKQRHVKLRCPLTGKEIIIATTQPVHKIYAVWTGPS